jgi:hypothetical protein
MAGLYGTARTFRKLAAILGVAVQPHPERKDMLYTIAVVLIILWLLGLVSSYTMGGLIHILLVIALIVIVVSFLTGRKV